MKRTWALLLASTFFVPVGCDRPREGPRTGDKSGAPTEFVPMMSTPFFTPGIDSPPMMPADQAQLGDGEEVIGIVVNGTARAYHVAALKTIRQHVINDLVKRDAVSVTYCDRTDCAQTFTAADQDKPLPIAVAGYMDGMLLRVGDKMYRQKTGKALVEGKDDMPHRVIAHERTTWAKWKKAHPDTTVYLGGGAPAPRPSFGQSDW